MTTTENFERLNVDCRCITLDLDELRRATVDAVGDAAFCSDLVASHPHLLSGQPLFLSSAHAQSMQTVIAAIEAVAATPQYQSAVMRHAPDIAKFVPGPVGVFMGYDFHLGPDGPKLIEINTNAGGGLINSYLLQAQRVCCAKMEPKAQAASNDPLLKSFLSNFQAEWRLQGRTTELRTIAIVDHSPAGQYLYPEFILFQRLFEAEGLTAAIVDPKDLEHRDGKLWNGGTRIDLVYNRLTDFDFSQSDNRVLRAAYLAGDVVVTPNPWTHALFANKKNLALLTDTASLRNCGVDDAVIDTLLHGIPRTTLVRGADPEELWARRSKLFFKPSSGFGGRAAYRGDKLTRKVWSEILVGDYVAQEIVQPSARTVWLDGLARNMKADLRNYTYDGKVQLVAARLYQGQTTNFRTPGGGFAPVFVGDDAQAIAC